MSAKAMHFTLTGVAVAITPIHQKSNVREHFGFDNIDGCGC